jgi:hypothetical protein
VRHDPVRNRFERHRRDRFLGFGVRGRRPRVAGLKQMIQLRQQNDLVVAIAAVLQRLFDRFEIFVRRYLRAFLAIGQALIGFQLFRLSATMAALSFIFRQL